MARIVEVSAKKTRRVMKGRTLNLKGEWNYGKHGTERGQS